MWPSPSSWEAIVIFARIFVFKGKERKNMLVSIPYIFTFSASDFLVLPWEIHTLPSIYKNTLTPNSHWGDYLQKSTIRTPQNNRPNLFLGRRLPTFSWYWGHTRTWVLHLARRRHRHSLPTAHTTAPSTCWLGHHYQRRSTSWPRRTQHSILA